MIRLQKHVRKILADAILAAGSIGGSAHIEKGGGNGHQKLVLERGGLRRVKPISCTPRDADAAVNMAKQDVRRMIREMCGV